MDYLTSYIVSRLALLVAIILILLSQPFKSIVLLVLGALIGLLGFFQTLIFFRCPHCRRYLNSRRGIPNHCPHCGKRLESF